MRILTASLATSILLFTFGTPADAQSVSKLGKALARAAKKEDYDTVKDALTRLGNTDNAKAAQVIVKSLGLVPIGEVYDEAVSALVTLGSEKVGPTFGKLLKKKRLADTPTAVIIAVAEQLDDEASEGWVLTAFEKGSSFVVRNAVPTLVKRKSKRAIPLLIDHLAKVGMDPSTESYQVRDALVALTGHDFETVEDWRNFWESRKDTLDPKNLDKEFEGPTGVARKHPGTYDPPEFFGVEILSNRVVFVVDTSGSMEWWDKRPDGSGEDEWRERRRIVRLKEQLKKVIANLPKQATFNIIAYGDYVKRFQPRAVPASSKIKKKALAFIEGMRPNGATHTDDAFNAAFEEKDVDTIVLLSDGAPSKVGQLQRQMITHILEQVDKLNKVAKVTVHTFGFTGEPELPPGLKRGPGGGSDEDIKPEEFEAFLKTLAENNRGKFTVIE